MVMHKFLTWLNFGLLRPVSLLWVGVFITTVTNPAIAQANAPTEPKPIGSFLDAIGGDTKIAAMGDASQPPQQLIHNLPDMLGYRVIKDKHMDPFQSADRVMAAYAQECLSHGGFIDVPTALNMKDLLAAQQSLTNGYGTSGDGQYLHKVAICSQNAERVLGTVLLLIQDKTPGRRAYGTVWLRDQSNRTLVIALPELADHSLAAAQLREDQRLAQERQEQALAARADQEAAIRWDATQKAWAEWRMTLAIGAESHCGPVITLRGPMVEIANAGVALWFRREALYPAGARNGFGSLITCRPE
ncbi:MAG: hypothetical protein RL481_1959 [Pseudomonadota bacterium]|jgi:hypothetical protein